MFTLYHGSTSKIEKPIFGFGKVHNDYGLGFYCTKELLLAKEWAVKSGNNGYVNEYTLNDSYLRILDLQDKKYCILHWIAILLENRTVSLNTAIARLGRDFILANYRTDYSSYDLIIGYRADDSYFSYTKDFLNNAISIRQLSLAMKLGNLGLQYVLKSNKAFELLKYEKAIPVPKTRYGNESQNRDAKAKHQYFTRVCNEILESDLFIRDIVKNKMSCNDINSVS